MGANIQPLLKHGQPKHLTSLGSTMKSVKINHGMWKSVYWTIYIT